METGLVIHKPHATMNGMACSWAQGCGRDVGYKHNKMAGLENMANVLQMTFPNAFFKENHMF